ncbi:hypothetical protein [Aureispira anguillae]|uniref:Outer membrane protein beta-barrel domain-containing protein n=1 Tax=Aureispira anguillae TaxID=2864201 RepID=A0A916DTV0_9BACT|nr:hypothetical protein [Aureispira anguillae]BDS12117.1 hypothetical protein AsAng_0028320 [Aureispira anguillae]
MKKVLLLLVCSFCIFSANAQDEPLTGKKGQLILPESGDIGLGVNMIPFFNWFGNSFNNNSNNLYASSNKFFNVFGNSVLMGKYMLSEKTAVRVHFGFNLTSISEKKYVRDNSSNNPMDMVLDARKADNGHYTLALGYEMRRGKGRIQGYYGADIIFNLDQNSGFEYSYGNGYSNANIVPTSFDWGNNLNGNQRVVMDGGSTTFGVGLRAFVGVEYFVAPKLSLGAEFGWGVRLNSTFESTSSSEYYEATTGEVMIENTVTGATTAFSAGVDNMNGAVFMFFYF